MINAYYMLGWWGRVVHSCETDDQLRNALNLWPKVMHGVPHVEDAWEEVRSAARANLGRIVGPLNTDLVCPQTAHHARERVFGP